MVSSLLLLLGHRRPPNVLLVAWLLSMSLSLLVPRVSLLLSCYIYMVSWLSLLCISDILLDK